MRKISTVLLSVMCAGLSAFAHEGEGNTGLNFSVYRNYSHMKFGNPEKMAQTQQQARQFLPGWNATTDKLNGTFTDMYGPAAQVQGSTNMEKAQILMKGKLAAMGVNADEWVNFRDVQVEHASFVDFSRVVEGHEVVFSNLSFRFTPDGRLQRVKMKNHGQPEPDMVPALTADDVLKGSAINTGLTGKVIGDKTVEKNWVWFPIPTAKGYTIHPAWRFRVTGIGMYEMPFDLTGYIDAVTGELLYRSNSVNETFEVTVKANVHLSTPVAPTTEVLMSDMRVEIGGNNYTTDDTGFLSVGSVTNPSTVTYAVRGPWSRVRVSGSTPDFDQLNPTSPGTYTLPISDTSKPEFRAVSAFYHVNKIHDYMLGHWPSFTGMNTPLNTNVDINGNTCNAFYNNGQYSINFYKPQTACRAFSIVSDIIYHEYGHGISYRFYSSQGANFSNGGLGEGNSDVWAMSINGDGVVGDGAYWSGGNIRSYTGAPKVFPQDLVGQVHADGEIIAGSWWDVAQNINSVDTMAILFAKTFYDIPNGPNGTEGDIYHDILISAIMNDDDDANLSNGTPHFEEIVKAFARHGIYLLSGAEFDHKEVPNQQANTAVTISGTLTISNPAFMDTLFMYYRNRYGTSWDSVAMTNTSGNTYTATIPGYPASAVVDYFFKAQDVTAASSYGMPAGYQRPPFPADEVTIPYQYGVGLGTKRFIYDFETTDQTNNWELGLGTDNASAGIWEAGTPVGTIANGLPVQPGNDNTTGSGRCLVTGNGAQTTGGDDVDDGKTTAVTPLMDFPFHEPIIEYHRWYSNDRGSSSNLRGDFWTVEMRMQTSQIWVKVDHTKQSDQRWRRRIFRVSEYFQPSAPVQLRFIAEDRVVSSQSNNGQNIIEAAVDDFIIYEGHPLSVENMPEDVTAEVYPNPADDIINIKVPVGSNGSVKLYDVTGKVLRQVEVTEKGVDYKLNTTDVAPGTYMVLVQTQYSIQNTKVVISHK